MTAMEEKLHRLQLADNGLIVDGPTPTRAGYWTVRRPDELNLRAAWTFAK